MPDPLFRTLFDDTDTMTWASTDEVRERARWRARRIRVTAVAAAVVATLAISGGAVAVAKLGRAVGPQPGASPSVAGPAPSGPSPSSASGQASPGSTAPTPPSSAEPTAIVDALFLQPGDVGTGYRVVTGGLGSGDWTFEFSTSALGCPQPASIPPPIVRRDRSLNRGTPQAEDTLAQYVARYRPGDAARYLDQVRARVSACQPGSGQSIKIGAQRFAGQDSLLIQVDFGGGSTATLVLVRQGDLLTEFFAKPERSSAASQDLGRKAARRLCSGTPAC